MMCYTTQQEKNSLWTYGPGTTRYPHEKEWSQTLPHITYKMNTKWNKDLYVKPKTIKLSEANIDINHCDLVYLRHHPLIQGHKDLHLWLSD